MWGPDSAKKERDGLTWTTLSVLPQVKTHQIQPLWRDKKHNPSTWSLFM